MRVPPPNPDAYTAAEIDYLVAHYPTRTLREIARALGRSEASVSKRTQCLVRVGVLRYEDRCYGRPWTPADDDALNDHYGLWSDDQFAKRLRRTPSAVRGRAYQLGIAKRMNFYTANTVAGIFGVDVHLVLKWIRVGALKAEKGHVGQANRRCWVIRDQEIERFIREHPEHYDPARMDRPSWWHSLAQKVHDADPWLTAEQAARAVGVCRETMIRQLRAGHFVGGRRRLGAGKFGEWRIPTSALAGFRRRKPSGRPRRLLEAA